MRKLYIFKQALLNLLYNVYIVDVFDLNNNVGCICTICDRYIYICVALKNETDKFYSETSLNQTLNKQSLVYTKL